jgi:hypothetical protein
MLIDCGALVWVMLFQFFASTTRPPARKFLQRRDEHGTPQPGSNFWKVP